MVHFIGFYRPPNVLVGRSLGLSVLPFGHELGDFLLSPFQCDWLGFNISCKPCRSLVEVRNQISLFPERQPSVSACVIDERMPIVACTGCTFYPLKIRYYVVRNVSFREGILLHSFIVPAEISSQYWPFWR
jgi:hypothetical protein